MTELDLTLGDMGDALVIILLLLAAFGSPDHG
jgi:hypothetical protein